MNAVLAYTAAFPGAARMASSRAVRSSPSAGWLDACSESFAGPTSQLTAGSASAATSAANAATKSSVRAMPRSYSGSPGFAPLKASNHWKPLSSKLSCSWYSFHETLAASSVSPIVSHAMPSGSESSSKHMRPPVLGSLPGTERPLLPAKRCSRLGHVAVKVLWKY